MKALHTVVLKIRGLSHAVADPCRDLLEGEGGAVRLFLTKHPEEQAQLAWQRLALSNVLLNAFVGRDPGGELEDRIATQLEQEINRAHERFGDGPFLVFLRTGEVPDFECQREESREDFDLGLEGEIPRGFREDSGSELRALMAGVSLQISQVSGYDEVLDQVVFFRADDRPFFTFKLRAEARGEVGYAIPGEAWDGLAESVERLKAQGGLDRVIKLLNSSLEKHEDRLRAFLAAWFGLEILVSKVFKEYEQAFFARIAADVVPGGSLAHVERIQEVMKDKYRLTDRFSLIATELAEADAEEDLKKFKEVKSARDELLHGQDTSDAELPIEDARTILRKYLDLHLVRV